MAAWTERAYFGARRVWAHLPEPVRDPVRRLLPDPPGTTLPTSWPLDLNGLVHALRGRALGREPGGAEVVLSGGATDEVYTQWFGEHYPTEPKRHVLVEKFREAPPNLPPGVEFVRGSLGDLEQIPDRSVDLVFAGQITEHLWAEDLSGFLLAANRILRPDGRLVVDSPNRSMTLATGWRMPEHTLELTTSEFKELLGLAGFDIESAEGIWLCSDPVTGKVLPLIPADSPLLWPVDRRVEAGVSDPDHCFVWWIRARRSGRPPDPQAVRHRTGELFATYRKELFGRLLQPMKGRASDRCGLPAVVAARRTEGHVLIGPVVALPEGPQRATFTFVPPPLPERLTARRSADPSAIAAVLEVSVELGHRVVAERRVRVGELPPDGKLAKIDLPFSLPGTTFGCETRVRTTGAVPLAVVRGVQVEADDRPAEEVGAATAPAVLPLDEGIAWH